MNRKQLVIIAAIVLVLAVWALRSGRDIRNSDSRGHAIIAFGDSLTAGYGAQAGEDWPSKVASDLAIPLVNAGVSGDTTQSALARIERDVLTKDPRIVIVGLGGNDFLQGVPIATTEANLREIVRKTQDAGAMVVLLGFRFPTLGASYEEMSERIADDEECLLIPDLLDGIMSDPSMKSDEIHPNAKGYAEMAKRIEGPLKKVL